MKNTDKAVKYFLSLHFAVLLFGGAALFARWLMLPALVIVAGRVFFAAISLAVLLKINKQLSFKQTNIALLVISGFLLAFHWFAFFRSLQLATIGLALLSYSTFPVFTAFLEPMIGTTKWRMSSVIFALIVFSGLYLVLPDKGSTNLLAVMWGVLSAISFALISIVNKKMTSQMSAFSISFYMNVFAFAGLLPFLFFIKISLSLNDIFLLVLLGVVFTALAHTLFIYGLKKISASHASLIAALEPVYGILLAFMLLNEVPSVKMIAGGLIIMATIFISTFQERKG